MPQYIFLYRTAQSHPTAPMDEVLAAWSGWPDSHSSTIVDPGRPVFERATVSEVGAKTALRGYSIASWIARMSPALNDATAGGGGHTSVPPRKPTATTIS